MVRRDAEKSPAQGRAAQALVREAERLQQRFIEGRCICNSASGGASIDEARAQTRRGGLVPWCEKEECGHSLETGLRRICLRAHTRASHSSGALRQIDDKRTYSQTILIRLPGSERG